MMAISIRSFKRLFRNAGICRLTATFPTGVFRRVREFAIDVRQ